MCRTSAGPRRPFAPPSRFSRRRLASRWSSSFRVARRTGGFRRKARSIGSGNICCRPSRWGTTEYLRRWPALKLTRQTKAKGKPRAGALSVAKGWAKGKGVQTELIISGFGGQGALFAGTLLAFTGLENNKHVTWIPSYGPGVRGGGGRLTGIVSDEDIGPPIVRNPAGAIVMNIPSLERYEFLVRPGGALIVHASLVGRAPARGHL